MNASHVYYDPGSQTLLARDDRYLLVDVLPDEPAIPELWKALAAQGPDVVAGALAQYLPGTRYCLIEIDGSSVQVRHEGLAPTLDGTPIPMQPTGPTALDADRISTIRVAVGTRGSAAALPIVGGIVGASALRVEHLPGASPAADRSSTDLYSAVWHNAPDSDRTDGLELTGAPDSSAALADSPLADVSPPPESAAAVPEVAPDPQPGGTPITGPITAPPPAPGTAAGPTAAMVGPASPDRETVVAGICLHGHLSGVDPAHCRVCGSLMPSQTPHRIPRPVLGLLELPDGPDLELDRGAILGRAPRVPEDATEDIHLVNLAGYGRDISRQHAEVVVQGWSVAVRDLGSANGTRILGADGRVEVVEPGVLVPLRPDDSIEIAETTTVRYRAR